MPPSVDDRTSGQRERHRRRSSRRHHRESSLSPSGSSSDDELTRGHHSLYYNGQRIKPRKQWHLSAIRTVRTRYALIEDAKISISRNKFEGEELAAVLDQLLIAHDYINQPVIAIDHITRTRTAISVAMELATRRLEGIIRADKHGGDWSYASALSLLQRAKLGNDDLDRYVTLDVARTRTANKGNTNSNGRGNDSSSSPTAWRWSWQRW